MEGVRMRYLSLAILATLLVFISPAAAAEEHVFQLGFADLASQIPDIAGQPIGPEQYAHNGDSIQLTTTGMMVWRKIDNWTAFTNGSRTWLNGPLGLQDRANENRYGWESLGVGSATEAVTVSSVKALSLADLAKAGSEYTPRGIVVSTFGMSAEIAKDVLFPVSKRLSLAPEYEPDDLVYSSNFGVPGALIRAIVGPDLLAMQRDSGGLLYAISGYRSHGYQAGLFNSYVASEMRGDGIAAAEARANRYSARPGQSQHQLGTVLDFNSLDQSFELTQAGRWLMDNSWRYGFIMSYTPVGEIRTGYMYEPWHYRWVGRHLASIMWQRGYINDAVHSPDDYCYAIYQVLADNHF
jgi:D-alanyl-D-alanine carboxypeptidase